MGEERIKVHFSNANGGKVIREDGEYSIKEICEMLNISLEKVVENKEKGMSWEDAIREIKGSCYMNMFGNLIIPEEVIDRVEKQRIKKTKMEKYMVKARILTNFDIEMEYDEYSDKVQIVYMRKREDGDIRIPDYVDYIRLSAWNKDCDGCTIYIPAGCDVEMVDGRYLINNFEKFKIDWGIAEHTKHIEVDSEHKTLLSQDGVLYNKDMTELLAYPKYKEDYKYIIPDTVKCIDEGAFCFPDNLKELEVKNGVKFDYVDLSGIQGIEIIEK